MVIQFNRKETSDQNAITKAAAWAWYERGSWFEHKTIRETDVRRPQDYTPRPSRYKIEAMKEAQSCNRSLCNEHIGNSLLDMYEIERISRELCCYVESSRVDRHSRSVDGGDPALSKETNGERINKKHKRGWRRRGIMCGSRSADVVEHMLLVGGRHPH
ncbi:hypothetical protein R6Q59_019989 [Mikania micrantha]|uniref:Uncharacterized protein n=1 Tax=Mikania micrantha TaxID=192012 RepID=A0A5N6PRG7_9ASTR|nr:hypothetical protein E3N88_07038 [Mikania micrantha]